MSPAAWWTSSSGRIELRIREEDARSCSHSGQCDDDVAALRKASYIAEQLANVDPTKLKDELREYGAWDEGQLVDHEDNLNRILWFACGDLVDASDPVTDWSEAGVGDEH